MQSKIKLNLKPSVPKLRLVDLFTGTGAFSYAFESTDKVKSVWANDLMESSKAIYKLNFPSTFVVKDLNDIDVKDIPSHDILTGGFPCQPFSIAGHRQGFKDARSNVFWKIVEIIGHHLPRVVLLENVKNLQSHDDGRTFQTISDEITKLGYLIKTQVMNTCQVTEVPQNRERIYFVCFREQADYDLFRFPDLIGSRRDVKDYLETTVDASYYYGSKYKVWTVVEAGVTKLIDTNTVYQLRRQYIRENKSGVCPTLTANMGQGGHNVPLIRDSKGIRKLTPRECFNLQGFPQSYQLPALADSALYKLAGNAVSVPVIQLLAKQITQILGANLKANPTPRQKLVLIARP